jgi:hypothetical protein
LQTPKKLKKTGFGGSKTPKNWKNLIVFGLFVHFLHPPEPPKSEKNTGKPPSGPGFDQKNPKNLIVFGLFVHFLHTPKKSAKKTRKI